EKPQHKHTQPIKSHPKKIRAHSCPFVVQIPPPPTPRKTPAQAHSTNQVPTPKKFVSIRGSNTPRLPATFHSAAFDF
ncbi:MAG: hypothetical protein ACK6D5_05925, partial [Planctomyces sp.]